jgi:hypothetical protein
MDQINKALLNQLTQKIGVMKGMQMSDEEIEKSFDKSELDLIEKAVVENNIEKGGSRAILGEIRKFGGRDYIKTHDGWKFHGKGTGAKAQEHKAGTSSTDKKEEVQIEAPKEEKKEPVSAPEPVKLEEKEEVKVDSRNVTIKGKEWKFDESAMSNLSSTERSEIINAMSEGYFSTKRLSEETNKVEIKPGGEYSLSQFANSLGKTNSDAAQRKFIKENKDGFYNYSTDDRTSSEEVATLIAAVGDKNNIFNYFNKNYSPTNIKVKDIASIKEEVQSSNIYALMGADQYKVREFSFQVKVKYTEAPITVKTRILMNNKLSMRDIASFM